MEEQYNRIYFWKQQPVIQIQLAPTTTELIKFKPSSIQSTIYYNHPEPNMTRLTFPDGFAADLAIRPQQRFYFTLLQNVIEQNLDKLENRPHYYRMDIPMWDGEYYRTIRYFRLIDKDEIIFLQIADNYTGEPLRPTIGYLNDSEKYPFLEEPIPETWNWEALNALNRNREKIKFPFSDASVELLNAMLEYLPSKGIAEYVTQKESKAIMNAIIQNTGITSDVYGDRKKNISEQVRKALAIKFDYYMQVAQYWLDMGLTFPRV